MKEIRKDIPWFENQYQASNLGYIRCLDRNDSLGRPRKGKLLSVINHTSWYKCTMICKNAKSKLYYTHILVAKAFIGESNWLYVNHIDWIKNNNKASNLEYVTASENIRRKKINKQKPLVTTLLSRKGY